MASRRPSWRWSTVFAWSVVDELDEVRSQRNFISGLLLEADMHFLSLELWNHGSKEDRRMMVIFPVIALGYVSTRIMKGVPAKNCLQT